MCTSGKNVRISDEAERVQSVSYSHIRSLSGLYTVVCLKEGKRDACLGPSLLEAPLKVFPNHIVIQNSAFKGAPKSNSIV